MKFYNNKNYTAFRFTYSFVSADGGGTQMKIFSSQSIPPSPKSQAR
jgi:hypothetical protein